MASQPNDRSNEHEMPKFRYAPLPTAASIRLLYVLPAPGPEAPLGQHEVKCEVKVVDLDDNIEFNALSYTWGNPTTIRETLLGDTVKGPTMEKVIDLLRDRGCITFPERLDLPDGTPSRGINLIDGELAKYFYENPWLPRESVQWDISGTRQIECNGQTLDVSESLYGILEYLSLIGLWEAWDKISDDAENLRQSLRKPIWVDAICINQSDLDERKAQVMLMSRTFRSAVTVIGWLGPKDRLADLFFHAALILFDFQDKAETTIVTSLDSVPGMNNGLWFSVYALLQRLWFRRAWVAQEIVSFPHDSGLEEELNTLGHSLLTGDILQPELKRMWHDAMICGILGKAKGISGGGAAPHLQIRPKDAYTFILGVRYIRERLGLTPAGRLVYERQKSEMRESLRKDQGFRASKTVYAERLTYRGPETGIPGNTPIKKGKDLIPLIRKMSHDKKNSIVLGLVSDIATSILCIDRSLGLIEVLSAFRSCSSTDPRDKVYAFLGIATRNLGIVPDYGISVVDAFRTTAGTILAQGGGLVLLSHIQDLGDTTTPGLPSWVPDFVSPLGKTAVTEHRSTIFNASGRRLEFLCKIATNNSEFCLEGYKVDDVARVFGFDHGHDLATSVLRFGLEIPTPYPNLSHGMRATLENFLGPMKYIDGLGEFFTTMLPQLPDAKLYLAVEGSLVEAPLPDLTDTTTISANGNGTNEAETSAEQEAAVPPPPSEILWRCLTADGWHNRDLANPGTENSSALGKSFSDWLLCSMIDSYRLATDVIDLVLASSSSSSQTEEAEDSTNTEDTRQKEEASPLDWIGLTPDTIARLHASESQTGIEGDVEETQREASPLLKTQKRLLLNRVRRKLDAWMDLSIYCIRNKGGGGPGPSDSGIAGDAFDRIVGAKAFLASTTDIAAWFKIYTLCAGYVLHSIAADHHHRVVDPASEGDDNSPLDLMFDPNLPGPLPFLNLQLAQDQGRAAIRATDIQASAAKEKTSSTSTSYGVDPSKNGPMLLPMRAVTDTKSLLNAPTQERITDFETRMREATAGRVPFILRPAGDGDGRFRVVGEAYVYGIMEGQAVPSNHDQFVPVTLV
ncbi:heterokaryon incompatibility protein-domain-containing protein [Lasiosphaeria miniovina]|uniref:Heterokaryon incompatibility protein-domain-containing protein n=1 Tax=Lasiosphaeria miniovina TaxID=1954250 RepID=A0AA40AE34_9PEZI|nr:heterokaryon incompatibility protein-domain-containing protein [Lasiosphaeria miniovina]KAK0713983.1 heterokaryon incompatibility protein-domain-containing protein [Lasiosphaeria miniovina]